MILSILHWTPAMKKDKDQKSWEVQEKKRQDKYKKIQEYSDVSYTCGGMGCRTKIIKGIFCSFCLEEYKEDPEAHK